MAYIIVCIHLKIFLRETFWIDVCSIKNIEKIDLNFGYAIHTLIQVSNKNLEKGNKTCFVCKTVTNGMNATDTFVAEKNAVDFNI